MMRATGGAEFLKSTFLGPIVMLEDTSFFAEVCNRGVIPNGGTEDGVLMSLPGSERGIVPSCVPHGTGDLESSLVRR